MAELITESRLQAFRTCPKLHHYQYIERARPVVDKDALTFGSMIHAGLEAWWKAWLDTATEPAINYAARAIALYARDNAIDVFTAARATVLMLGYSLRWSLEMEDLEVLAVEVQFETQMHGPKGGVARSLVLGGKIDVIVRRRSTGKTWILEHKTSGADLRPGSSYWTRLRMDPQISVYFDGAKALGHEVEGCIYDVIDKPAQRPLKATPVEKREYKKDGTLYAKQRAEDETVDEYASRLTLAIAEAPEQFYQRAEVIRLDGEMDEARLDTYATAAMLRDSMRMGRAPRNPSACHLYGSDCSYLDVCSGVASLDDPTRFKRTKIHPELEQKPDAEREGTP